jgi:hypothetical protein
MKVKPLICYVCHTGGCEQGIAFDGRPEFHCTKCNHWWTSGHDGAPYYDKRRPNTFDHRGEHLRGKLPRQTAEDRKIHYELFGEPMPKDGRRSRRED